MKKKMTPTLFTNSIARTRFFPQPYRIDGIDIAIGLVDKLDNGVFLAMSYSQILLGGLIMCSAIVISTDDVAYLLDKCNHIDLVRGILRFVIDHEVGHIQQWKMFPDTIKPGKIETSLEPELIADAYAIRASGIREDIYRTYMDVMFDGVINTFLSRVSGIGPIRKRLLTWNNRMLFRSRVRKVTQRATYGIEGCLPSDTTSQSYFIANRLVIGPLISQNEGRWTED